MGYDFVSKPDVIWNRRAMAKAAFAHYLNWVNPSIQKNPTDFVRNDKPDWVSARENNTDVQTGNVNKIVERSDMFAGCIKAAMPPRT